MLRFKQVLLMLRFKQVLMLRKIKNLLIGPETFAMYLGDGNGGSWGKVDPVPACLLTSHLRAWCLETSAYMCIHVQYQ